MSGGGHLVNPFNSPSVSVQLHMQLHMQLHTKVLGVCLTMEQSGSGHDFFPTTP